MPQENFFLEEMKEKDKTAERKRQMEVKVSPLQTYNCKMP